MLKGGPSPAAIETRERGRAAAEAGFVENERRSLEGEEGSGELGKESLKK